jgi:hypothetical protein
MIVNRIAAHNPRTIRAKASTGPFSIDAVLSTENRVVIYSPTVGDLCEEILLCDGGRFPAKVPLLSDHTRTCDAVCGSVSRFQKLGTKWSGYMTLSANQPRLIADIEDKHLTAVSIGYQVKRSVRLRKGQTGTVRGQAYEASKDLDLLVALEWQCVEVSLVVIPADPDCRIGSVGALGNSRAYFAS